MAPPADAESDRPSASAESRALRIGRSCGQAYVASLYYVPKRSTILAFVLLFVVGTVLFVFLSPENFYPVQNSPTQTGSSPDRPSGAEPATVNYVHDGDTL